MKVRELVEQLGSLDPEMEILCCSEDEAILPKGHGFRLLEINGVDVSEGERQRGDDEVPTLKLGKGDSAERIAVISVTCDF